MLREPITDAQVAAAFSQLLAINEGPITRSCQRRREPAGKIFVLQLAHHLPLPPKPSGNFNFVLSEVVTLNVCVRWTGDGVRVVEPGRQVARHRRLINLRLAARSN